MILALVLVVAVISQANRPGLYEPFFGENTQNETPNALTVSQQTNPNGSQTTRAPDAGSPQQATSQQAAGDRTNGNRISADDKRIASALSKTLSEDDQRRWMIFLLTATGTDRQSDQDAEAEQNQASQQTLLAIEDSIDGLLSTLASIDDVPEPDRQRWESFLEQLASGTPNLDAPGIDAERGDAETGGAETSSDSKASQTLTDESTGPKPASNRDLALGMAGRAGATGVYPRRRRKRLARRRLRRVLLPAGTK